MTAQLPNNLGRALRGFFTDHLPKIRGASPHTVLSYRDALALLLRFVASRCARPVASLDLGDLSVENVLAFLDHLEIDRDNDCATRNARLAAIHTFARYVAGGYPEYLELCQSLLAVPFKRARLRIVEYLEADEMRAILQAPDRESREGRRDHALFLALFNTGARVQEIVDLRPCDLQLQRPLQVRLHGKGRKERICPLWLSTAQTLHDLIVERGVATDDSAPLFRNARGEPLTRFGIRYLLNKYAGLAQSSVPTLARKRVHPHILRHTTAVHLLQAGVDLITISHWLGHASVETTNRYAEVDLEMKRAALAKAAPLADIDASLAGWRSDASILEWLEAL
jgi:integrase/recombinase XerD